MSNAYWVTGDTLAVLRSMPSASVDMVLTSPPFLALRSYLPADDPAKGQEIGQEGTPGEFLDVLLDITEELRRVLAPHGSICVELGDTYSGSGGAGGDYNEGGLRDGQAAFKGSGARDRPQDDTDGTMKYARVPSDGRPPIRDMNGRKQGGGHGWPEAKSLCLIPELYRIALAYGRNPLTGRETPRWKVRNTVRWVRPNPPVGALGDKFRPATSDMVIACMARDRYFDLDAVRFPADPANKRPSELKRSDIAGRTDQVMNPLGPDGQRIIANPAGAPPLDWWEIPTHPYRGSHYATFPPALVEKPIKAMCPLKVCTVCGEPSRRIVEVEQQSTGRTTNGPKGGQVHAGEEGVVQQYGNRTLSVSTTLGWSDCGHNAWRTGRVLDIFGGSGTTLAVATGHGRDAIGIDLDARNVSLARDRIGMFLTEVTVDELREVLSDGKAGPEGDRPRDPLLAESEEGAA